MRRFVVAPRRKQQGADVESILRVFLIEIARPPTLGDSLVELSNRGVGPTGVPVEFDVLGAELGKPAISRGGFRVTLAVAQYPGADAQHLRPVADPQDRAPSASERIVASPLVEQRFRQMAIKSGVRLAVAVGSLEIGEEIGRAHV